MTRTASRGLVVAFVAVMTCSLVFAAATPAAAGGPLVDDESAAGPMDIDGLLNDTVGIADDGSRSVEGDDATNVSTNTTDAANASDAADGSNVTDETATPDPTPASEQTPAATADGAGGGAVEETVETVGNGTAETANATTDTVEETVDGDTNETAAAVEETANDTGRTFRATTDATTGTVGDATGRVGGTVDDATATTANGTTDVTTTVDRTASSTTRAVADGDDAVTGAIGNLTDDEAAANLTTVVDRTTEILRGTTDAVTDTVDRTVAATGDVLTSTATEGPSTYEGTGQEAYGWSTGVPAESADAVEEPATGAVRGPASDPPDEEAATTETSADGPPVPGPGPGPAGGAPLFGALVVGGSLVATRSGMAASTMGSGATTLSRATLSLFREFLARVAVLAGYSRYEFEDPLENENRAAVLEAVESSPGINLTSLVDATGLAESTARYHLRVLEHEDLLEGAKVRGRRRYVPRTDDDVELLAAFEEEATRDVLAALFEHEPATGTTLAEALERDPSTVSHHLSRLSEAGLVDRERDGPALRNSLAPEVRRTFSEVEVTSSVQRHVHADD